MILPSAKKLLEDAEISAEDFDFLLSSYRLSAENRRYYFIEDSFDKERNTAVTRVLRLLDENTTNYTSALYFDIAAESDYSGFQEKLRFPLIHSYNEEVDTLLLSPRCGTLKKDEMQLFQIISGNFSDIGLFYDGTFVAMKKNAENDTIFSLEIIPSQTFGENCDEIFVYASKNGRNYKSLIEFCLE